MAPPVGPNDRSHHRRFLVRGLPSEVIAGNVLNTNNAQWTNIVQFLDFCALHAAGAPVPVNPAPPNYRSRLGIRYKNPATAPSPLSVIRGIDTHRLHIEPQLIGIPAGTSPQWRLRGISDPYRQINRVWVQDRNVDAVGVEPAYTVLGPSRRAIVDLGAVALLNQGKIQRLDYLYTLLTQYVVIGLRNKRTGRIFRQLAGRSRNRS
jgi:hypothetical protein